MGKYDPLKSFLTSRSSDRIPMTFREIEGVLGFALPKSKRYPAWWSNNPSNNTMTEAWLEAGFSTEQVDTVSERLVFRRGRSGPDSGPTAQTSAAGALSRLRAKLAGTVTFAPGFDPTEPTGEAWNAER
jgi:hypothetical protein